MLLEWNAHACRTLRHNKNAGFPPVDSWNIVEGDAREFRFADIGSPVDLVAGGPPCQPFSLGGNHKCYDDKRDMFPAAVNAVRELRPQAFVFENVKGLLRASFTNYLQYITLQLNHPDIVKGGDEQWEDHFSRLERHHAAGHASSSAYRTIVRLLNAADYGVPQRRERIFIVGFRSDLHTEWNFPTPTHTEGALIWAKWVTGSYWDEHRMSNKERPNPTEYDTARANRVIQEYGMFGPTNERWRTVRDAIANLPESPLNHEIRDGARCYPGHTGSDIDEPAKTLKAGDHGVPGGEYSALCGQPYNR